MISLFFILDGILAVIFIVVCYTIARHIIYFYIKHKQGKLMYYSQTINI